MARQAAWGTYGFIGDQTDFIDKEISFEEAIQEKIERIENATANDSYKDERLIQALADLYKNNFMGTNHDIHSSKITQENKIKLKMAYLAFYGEKSKSLRRRSIVKQLCGHVT